MYRLHHFTWYVRTYERTNERTETSGTCQYVSQIPVPERPAERTVSSSAAVRSWSLAYTVLGTQSVSLPYRISFLIYDVRAMGRNKRRRQPEYLLTHLCHNNLLWALFAPSFAQCSDDCAVPSRSRIHSLTLLALHVPVNTLTIIKYILILSMS
jgi:hypothetical protein